MPAVWWTGVLGGAAVCALGILVLVIAPRRRAAIWFGFFCIGFGGFYIPNNATDLLVAHDGTAPTWYPAFRILAQVPFIVVQVVATIGMARVFPRPVDATERGALWAGEATTAILATIAFAGSLDTLQGPEATLLSWLFYLVDAFRVAILYGFLVVLALRFRISDDAELRRLSALTAAGLTLFLGYVSGHGRYRQPSGIIGTSGAELLVGATYFAAGLALAAFWLASMRGPDRRLARNLAWLTLATMLVGLLLDAIGLQAGGWSRVLTALFLAYAVLKHQLLGIDVKVRFAISKSTIAAVFIAVFFISSEIAQQFFGDRLGGPYVGILAAGGLVFAIAPLSRIADRIALKAVPLQAVEGPIASPDLTEHEGMYRDAVRLALRDRKITRVEELHLFRLARGLGLAPDRAHEILVEVESQRRKKGASR